MENEEKKISLLFDTKAEGSSVELISYMVTNVLRRQFSKDMGNGIKYFATDCDEAPDFSANPPADIIIFENVSPKDASRAAALVKRTEKGARVLMPLESGILDDVRMSTSANVITYSLTDSSANICPNRITPLEEGGYMLEAVFQSDPTGRNALRNRLFPSYGKNVFCKMKVNSTDRKDIIHALKVFGFGLALNLDMKYVIKTLNNYVFDSMKNMPADEKPAEPAAAAPSRAAGREEKEFDED